MKIRVAFIIGQYPPEERKLREQVALSYATADIEIGILSTPASPYIRGMSPTDIQLAAPLFIEAFREAERQGFDAVVPLGRHRDDLPGRPGGLAHLAVASDRAMRGAPIA